MRHPAPPAELAVKALAERFATTAANFACFSVPDGDSTNTIVAYAAMSGIDLGEGLRSWRDIFDEKHDKAGIFLIKVGKRKYDCREGMTRAVYERIVFLREQQAKMLPDSMEWAEASGDLWTWTMLTGNCAINQASKEALDEVRVGRKVLRGTNSMPLISTSGGELYVTGSNPSEASPAVRFRPAVILG
jgi:hypothetical protein